MFFFRHGLEGPQEDVRRSAGRASNVTLYMIT